MNFPQGALPTQANVFQESAAIGRAFIAPAIAGVAVDRQRAGLNENFRWLTALRDCFAKHADRVDARFDDLLAILRSMSAIDAPAGQIHDSVCAFEETSPFTDRLAVPLCMPRPT